MATRFCNQIKDNGEPCRAQAVNGSKYCFLHDPQLAQEAAEARRLGGLRRKREVTVAGAYYLGDLDTVAGIRRLIEVAAVDALGLENSVARTRALVHAAQVAAKLLEVGEMEQRLDALEQSLKERSNQDSHPVFDPSDLEQEEMT